MKVVIDKFLEDNNLKINWVEEQICKDNKSFLAQYKKDEDCIIMYRRTIDKEYSVNFSNRCSKNEFYKIIFCHELGHKLDDQLDKSDQIIFDAQLIIAAHKRGENIAEYGADYHTEENKSYSERIKKEQRAFDIGKKYINNKKLESIFIDMQQTNLSSIK